MSFVFVAFCIIETRLEIGSAFWEQQITCLISFAAYITSKKQGFVNFVLACGSTIIITFFIQKIVLALPASLLCYVHTPKLSLRLRIKLICLKNIYNLHFSCTWNLRHGYLFWLKICLRNANPG